MIQKMYATRYIMHLHARNRHRPLCLQTLHRITISAISKFHEGCFVVSWPKRPVRLILLNLIIYVLLLCVFYFRKLCNVESTEKPQFQFSKCAVKLLPRRSTNFSGTFTHIAHILPSRSVHIRLNSPIRIRKVALSLY